MKLPRDVVVAEEKLTGYLLVWRARNDKSRYLAQAGYDLSNWPVLEADLRQLARTAEAESEGHMEIELFSEVALARDIPEQGLCRGDVATVVENLPGTEASGGEDGYILEVFNAIGKTIAVVTVPVSAVEPLRATEVLSVRPIQQTT